MRRTLLFLLAVVLLLVGGWTGYWFYAAREVRNAVRAWADARRAEGYVIVWDRLEVGGYPFAFQVRVEQLQLSDPRYDPQRGVSTPLLLAQSAAWDLRRWTLYGSHGISARVAPSDVRPASIIGAASYTGSVEPGEEALAVDLALDNVASKGEIELTAAHAAARIQVPNRSPAGHTDLFGRARIDFRELVLPQPVNPLGSRIQRGEITLAVKGPVRAGSPEKALRRWRDEGGTIEVEALNLQWDALNATAQGTLSLDADMQPIAAMTATLQGWGEILDALVMDGTMKPGDAMLARVGLGLLAKPGPGGRSQLTGPVTIQNSSLFIAQVRIARLPRVRWE